MIPVTLNVKVFLLQLCFLMFPTKLHNWLLACSGSLPTVVFFFFYCVPFLTALSCPFVSHEAVTEEIGTRDPWKQFEWPLKRALMGHGLFNSFLFFPPWTLLLVLRTKTAGLKPPSHQLTSLPHRLRSVSHPSALSQLLDGCNTLQLKRTRSDYWGDIYDLPHKHAASRPTNPTWIKWKLETG